MPNMQSPRLPAFSEEALTAEQRALAELIRSARVVNSNWPARSRFICMRRLSATSPRNSAGICDLRQRAAAAFRIRYPV